MPLVYALPLGVRVLVWDDARYVETRFPDLTTPVGGTLEPTHDNRAQAAELGYSADAAGCWDALVRHELLHNLVCATLLAEFSPALRHEAGDPRPYWLRLWEEAIVLATERWLNTAEVHPPTLPFEAWLPRWAEALARTLAAGREG